MAAAARPEDAKNAFQGDGVMERLQPHELIDLCLLILAADGHVPAGRALEIVQKMGAPEFQPTRDVVAGRVQQLQAAGNVVLDTDAPHAMVAELRLTALGREYAASLVTTRRSPDCGYLRLCFALKLALADLLSEADRRAILAQLLQEHDSAERDADAAARNCPAHTPALRAWWAQQAAQRHAERALLQDLAD